MAKHSSGYYERMAAKAKRREQARIQSDATKTLPSEGSAVRSRGLEEYIYHSLWARSPDKAVNMTYKVECFPADIQAVGGVAACGIAPIATATNPDTIPGVRSSGVSANRFFWYRGATQAIYRHTKTGDVRAQYYDGKTTNSGEHVRSHHSAVLSTVTPPPTIAGVLALYDAIVVGHGKTLMGNKNGKLWLQVETATRQFEENGA
jgi:hypothetical protein